MSFEGSYFIGLNDIEEKGKYMWDRETEATSFTNWHSTHPKAGNVENNRDCVVISLNINSGNGKWKTKLCNISYQFICECPDGPCA